jgi:hypothetical protein
MNEYVHRLDNLTVGLNSSKPSEKTGFVLFGKDEATKFPEDGNVTVYFGSTGYGGVYTRVSFDRSSFIRLMAAGSTNSRLLREAFKPEAILLTPLDGQAPLRLTASSIKLDGDEFIVVDPDGNEQRFKATDYLLSLAVHEEKKAIDDDVAEDDE